MRNLPLLFIPLASFAWPRCVPADVPDLEQLRAEYAMRFLEPETHVALAKYCHDRGNRLLAFSILEYARRSKFERKEFDDAFHRAFLGKKPFDNSKKAEIALLKRYAADKTSREVLTSIADIYISRGDWKRAKNCLKALIALKPDDFENVAALAEVVRRDGDAEGAERIVKKFFEDYPRSKAAYERKIQPLIRTNPQEAKRVLAEAMRDYPKEGGFVFSLAAVLQHEGKIDEAKANMLKAAQLAPDSSHIQGWVGRFLLKAAKDEHKALDHYLNAYFLDPHFYDTEYAESRIRELSLKSSKAELEKRLKAGTGLETIVQDDNPMIVALGIERMAKVWDGKYVGAIVDLMGHDDPNVRWQATATLMKHADETFDATLDKLLEDPDLRKRGLAAYIAIDRRKEKSFSRLKELLKEHSQLLRFDAISALLQFGGAEGRRIAKEHLSKEQHPWFKRMAGRMMQ